MNELSIEVAAKECHEKAVSYFRVAEHYGYKFIMEIKEIRDKQYYKALGFSSFEAYCESAWKTKRDFMDERILIAESFGNEREFDGTYRQLGHSKSLLLARMEPEVRRQVESTINVNEATVRELKEAQRRVQEAERRAHEAEQRATDLYARLEAEMNKPPQTVTVVPESVKRQLEEKDHHIRTLRAGYQEAKAKLEQYELRNADEFDAERARKEREKLQHEADLNTLQLRVHFKNFIEKAAITPFLHGAIASASEAEKRHLQELVEAAQKIIDQTLTALRGRKEIEL